MKDVFICENTRTAIGRYAGSLASVRPDDLLGHVLSAVIKKAGISGDAIEEVFTGCSNQAGEDNRNIARMSLLLGGLPDTVPGITLNRLCGSGLDAVGTAARAIASGDMDVAIASGVESMTRSPYVMGKGESAYARGAQLEDTTMGWRFINKRLKSQYGVETMPETAENVAEDFNISREDQDAFALRSQQKAAMAQQAGRFDQEITPIEVAISRKETKIFDRDEHIRADTSLEKLAALKTPFRANGTVTAGNASGINDGACAMILASAEGVKKHNLTPIARVTGMATAGVAPRIMGIGPAPATEKLMARTDAKISDYDVIELNEAFASQGLAVLRRLGLPDDADHVNPNGGAIALGHPLGMSGARMVMTAARELALTGGKKALCTMCIGVGQGIALSLEKV